MNMNSVALLSWLCQRRKEGKKGKREKDNPHPRPRTGSWAWLHLSHWLIQQLLYPLLWVIATCLERIVNLCLMVVSTFLPFPWWNFWKRGINQGGFQDRNFMGSRSPLSCVHMCLGRVLCTCGCVHFCVYGDQRSAPGIFVNPFLAFFLKQTWSPPTHLGRLASKF